MKHPCKKCQDRWLCHPYEGTCQTKVIAIEKVANMETHNSVSKDKLIHALRWLYEHYDFER